MDQPLRVLIIEDSEDDTFLINRELKRGGYNVTLQRVDNAIDMQSALSQKSWDIVISDYNLPGFDGLAALRLFKQHQQDLPFILVSGAVGEEIAVDAMKAGAQDYVKKDNLTRLIPAIDRELREAQIRQERKHIQEMLEESEERYRSLVENIPIGVYRFTPDQDGAVLMANPAFLSMFKIEEDELPHATMSRLYADPRDGQRMAATLLNLGRITGEEIQFRKSDGSLIWGSVTARAAQLRNGQVAYLDCTIEDITARKQSDKLKEALYQISQAANTAQTLEDLISLFHKTIGELMLATNFYLALYDPTTELISFPYFVDEYDSPPDPIHADEGLTSYVIRTGEPLLVSPDIFNRLQNEGTVKLIGAPSVDWLGVPLKTAENKTIGALVVQTYNERVRYTEQDRAVLTFVSSQAAMAIERKRAEDALRSSEARQRALLDAIPDLILVIDKEGVVKDYKSPDSGMGIPLHQAMGKNISELLPKRVANQAVELAKQVLQTNVVRLFEFDYLTGTEGNHPQNFEVRMSSSGEDQVLMLIRDVTEHKKAEMQVEEQRAYLHQVIDINPNFIFAKDREGRFTLANQAVAEAFGTTVEDLIGKTEANFTYQPFETMALRQEDLEVIHTLREKIIPEEPFVDSTGKTRWLQTVKRPLILPEKNEIQVLGVSTDITERKNSAEQLIHNAFHDALTGLPNRELLLDRLDRALERARRHKDTFFAVLLLDLDNFKLVNDSLGHMIGDSLLIAVAGRLASCLRTADTIARTGGDEYVILLEDLENVLSLNQIGDRILKEISVPFDLEGHHVVITTSIGIVLSSSNYEKPEEMLRDADIAMYRAKAMGRNRYALFSNVMRVNVLANLQLETDLRQAIERNELELHYEPIVDLRTGQTKSLEALIRWRHPRRGLVFPGEFIPFAEETGSIIPIGEWVLTEACRQMKRWHSLYPAARSMTVSVNLSNRQFSQPDLVSQINKILRQTGFDPHYLHLEITETVIMENADLAIAALRELREMGVQIHVDDFGTGYSSLVYLHRLPLNAIKIDRSFVSGKGESATGMEIAHTIIRLANDLRMETIAEGVETEIQLRKLIRMGCDCAQGFVISRTLESQSVDNFIQNSMGKIGWIAHLNPSGEPDI